MSEKMPSEGPVPRGPRSKKGAASKYDMVKVKVWLGQDMDHKDYYVLSRFLISRMLTVTMVPSSKANRVALETKKLLVDSNRLELSQADFEEVLFKILTSKGFGDEYIRRYRTVNQFYQMRQPLVILIGGAPWTGKSTISQQLAARLNMPNVMQTNIVYEIVRLGKQQQASLHPQPLCERLDLSAAELVAEFRRECLVVRKGLDGDLAKCLNDGKPLIIEGMHLDPGQLLDELTGLGIILMPEHPQAAGALGRPGQQQRGHEGDAPQAVDGQWFVNDQPPVVGQADTLPGWEGSEGRHRPSGVGELPLGKDLEVSFDTQLYGVSGRSMRASPRTPRDPIARASSPHRQDYPAPSPSFAVPPPLRLDEHSVSLQDDADGEAVSLLTRQIARDHAQCGGLMKDAAAVAVEKTTVPQRRASAGETLGWHWVSSPLHSAASRLGSFTPLNNADAADGSSEHCAPTSASASKAQTLFALSTSGGTTVSDVAAGGGLQRPSGSINWLVRLQGGLTASDAHTGGASAATRRAPGRMPASAKSLLRSQFAALLPPLSSLTLPHSRDSLAPSCSCSDQQQQQPGSGGAAAAAGAPVTSAFAWGCFSPRSSAKLLHLQQPLTGTRLIRHKSLDTILDEESCSGSQAGSYRNPADQLLVIASEGKAAAGCMADPERESRLVGGLEACEMTGAGGPSQERERKACGLTGAGWQPPPDALPDPRTPERLQDMPETSDLMRAPAPVALEDAALESISADDAAEATRSSCAVRPDAAPSLQPLRPLFIPIMLRMNGIDHELMAEDSALAAGWPTRRAAAGQSLVAHGAPAGQPGGLDASLCPATKTSGSMPPPVGTPAASEHPRPSLPPPPQQPKPGVSFEGSELRQAQVLQEYLASYESVGMPMLDVRYGDFTATLDMLHAYVLQCIEAAVDWMSYV